MHVRTFRPLAFTALLALSASCGGGDTTLPPDDTPPPSFPVIDRFEANVGAVPPGSTVTISWSVRFADRLRIEPGLVASTDAAEGSVETPPLQDSVAYTLIAESAAGETRRSLAITLVTGKADILRFEADPAVIAPGESTTLHWETMGASRVRIAEVGGGTLYDGQDATGSRPITPAQSTSYEITIEGDESGPKTQTADVLVGAPPRIVAFTANPAQVTEGAATTLSWQVENADGIVLHDQTGAIVVPNPMPSGSTSVNLTADDMFTLIASNAIGNAQQAVGVTVVPPGSPRILAFTASPATLPGPGTTQVRWETADTDTVRLLVAGTEVSEFPGGASGTYDVSLSQTSMLTLVAENDDERTEQTVTVTVGTPDTTAPQIMHAPPTGVWTAGQAIEVDATIVDADSQVNAATLFYRRAGETMFTSLQLTDAGNDRFRATIPGMAVQPTAVEYYLQATDDAPAANSGTSPNGAPANVHRVMVQPDDTAAPTIMVTPVPADQSEGQAVMVSAAVADATGVANVVLYYKRTSETLFQTVPMTASGNVFTAQIPDAAVLPPAMDYYVEAEDTIAPPNVGREPAMAPAQTLTFSVIALDRAAPTVVHTPVANGQAAGMPVTVSAEVTDDSGVGTVVLYYKPRTAMTYQSVAMTGAGAQRVAQIPLAAVLQPAVDYYIEATDTAAPTTNTAVVPTTAPTTPYAFTVTPVDNAPPTISHTPIADGPVPGQALTVSAEVVDGSGVTLVNLYHRPRGSAAAFTQIPMTGMGATYSVTVPGTAVQAPGLEYYFEAVDGAPMANTAVLPMGAPGTPFVFGTGVGEGEPNNTTGQATVLLDGTRTQAIGVGAITPANDLDHWIIDVPAGMTRYTVRLEVTSGGAGQCSGDPELFLLGSDGTTVLVTDDTDGVSSCPLIDPTVDRGARALAPGRYYVRVEEDGRNRTIAQYELRARMDPVQCGNGILESAGGELCDDGNVVSGDGCSAMCQFEPDGTFMPPGGTATGAIQPAGDRDLYAITVTQGQFLTVFTSNGSGGCPGDTVIELYDTDGVTRRVTDDDDGSGTCSRLDPVRDTYVRTMAAGTYWLRVRGYRSSTQISAYTLTVQITDNYCGNNTIETGETCDDGNTQSGDGCSAMCQWETAGTATGMGGSFSDGISPAGNRDFYQVTVPDGYGISAQTWVASNGSCTADTVLRLYAADRTTQIATDDDGGLNRCSRIDPADDVTARGLAAGTYFVVVEEYGNNGTIPTYALDIGILAPVCGDGWVGGNEQCDDGNTAAGDGCNATCGWEGTGEVEPNNTRQTAGPLVGSGNTTGTVVGTLAASGDQDWYEVIVPAGASLLAEVVDTNGGCPVNSELRLYSVTGTELATDTRDGPGECPRISPGGNGTARNLGGGTYYLRVSGSASINTYVLNVRLYTAGCGDLYLGTGEQCDDGNTTPGDGCSATCTYELMEMEPNDTSSVAQTVPATVQVLSAGITAGDDDWYSVTVPQGGRIAAFTHQGAVDQCGSVDTRVSIYDATGTMELASDTNDGPGFCSAIYPTEAGALNAGTYRVRVRGFNSTQSFAYGLTIEVR